MCLRLTSPLALAQVYRNPDAIPIPIPIPEPQSQDYITPYGPLLTSSGAWWKCKGGWPTEYTPVTRTPDWPCPRLSHVPCTLAHQTLVPSPGRGRYTRSQFVAAFEELVVAHQPPSCGDATVCDELYEPTGHFGPNTNPSLAYPSLHPWASP